MAVDIRDTFRRGGKETIDLLEYCAISVQMDPVFLFLVTEYQTRPTADRALALFDMFCAPGAPGRIKADQVLPPQDYRIGKAIDEIRANIRQVEEYNAQAPEFPKSVNIPPKYLFDFILGHLQGQADGTLEKISRSYDPELRPVDNLPGGRMTSGQRMFVDRTWQPIIRPRLVAAGFRRIANVG